jgi:antitoxin (DNA-binding transcriptional repressor) of toxin-antitoxin stability system
MTMVILLPMKTISKSQLKSKMLSVFRALEQSGEELVVTDHGKPVLKIVALQPSPQKPAELFKPYRGRVVYRKDWMTPTENEWTET